MCTTGKKNYLSVTIFKDCVYALNKNTVTHAQFYLTSMFQSTDLEPKPLQLKLYTHLTKRDNIYKFSLARRT